MVEFIVSIIAVLVFAFVLLKTAIFSIAGSLITIAMKGVSAMLDSELDDDSKELAVRRAAFALFASTWQLLWRFALALAAAALPLLFADLAGLVSADATLALMMRLDYVVGVSIAGIALAWGAKRWRKPHNNETGLAAAVSNSAYDMGERFTHMLAFASPGLLRTTGRLEDLLSASTISAAPEPSPVFITSLARGGTTALLKAFHGMPQVATHEYRDMPFLTTPLIWSKMSGSRKVALRERAHGDGIKIDLDSPEAFDEVLWRLYWPEKYSKTSIDLWQKDDGKQEARDFMLRHFRKIIMLRRRAAAEAGEKPRYMSKNNANIARLRLLKTMFPGCEFVVPLRRPAAHAASLLGQHRNFAEQMRRDEFVFRYMRDIGHLEFGLLHRPIAFDGFMPGGLDPDTADYWLHYWIAAFEEVSAKGDGCHIVTQDSLRAEPVRVMNALCGRLQFAPTGQGVETHFRSEVDPQPKELFSASLLSRAESLYERLAVQAV